MDKSNTIVCRIDRAGVHFSATLCLPWAATNLDATAFGLTTRGAIHWELELQSFEKSRLFVAVTQFEADPNRFQAGRRAKAPVASLHFRPLERSSFLAQLSYYEIAQLEANLTPETEAQRETGPPEQLSFAASLDGTVGAGEPVRVDFRRPVRFSFPILELRMLDGAARGRVDLPGWPDVLEFSVPNPHLITEFNAIKPFFVRQLKRKTVRVAGALVQKPGSEARLVGMASPDLRRIDDAMVRVLRVRSLQNLLGGGQAAGPDRSLFTPEQFFDTAGDDAVGRALLPDDGMDLLASILSDREVRNARQLQFLATHLHAPGEPLRFTLRPQFGFVFLTLGEAATHFVLELLDSNATYGWSIPQGWGTAAEELRCVEAELAKIGDIGRQGYRRLGGYPHPFWLIPHGQVSSPLVDGFARWRYRLEEIVG